MLETLVVWGKQSFNKYKIGYIHLKHFNWCLKIYVKIY